MRETPLEQALRTIPGIYSVDVSKGFRDGGTVTVKDAVGTVVLTFEVWASNSRDTCALSCGSSLTYASEWDAIKVAAKVVYGFYYKACSDPKKSWEAAILRELRQSEAARQLPPAVADVVGRVRDLYEAARGQDGPRTMEELRKTMARAARRGATEDDVLAAWREVLVREVQES